MGAATWCMAPPTRARTGGVSAAWGAGDPAAAAAAGGAAASAQALCVWVGGTALALAWPAVPLAGQRTAVGLDARWPVVPPTVPSLLLPLGMAPLVPPPAVPLLQLPAGAAPAVAEGLQRRSETGNEPGVSPPAMAHLEQGTRQSGWSHGVGAGHGGPGWTVSCSARRRAGSGQLQEVIYPPCSSPCAATSYRAGKPTCPRVQQPLISLQPVQLPGEGRQDVLGLEGWVGAPVCEQPASAGACLLHKRPHTCPGQMGADKGERRKGRVRNTAVGSRPAMQATSPHEPGRCRSPG